MFKKIINKFKPKPIKKVYCRDCINMFIHNQPFDITSCSMKKIIKIEGNWENPPREIEIDILPYKENANNNCKHYKEKR